MAIHRKIESGKVDLLLLDPLNPRLGRHFADSKPNQAQILEKMKEFVLEEIAVSFVDSGFWPQEPLIVVREPLPGSRDPAPKMIVVEGNRRLAAVKLLMAAHSGKEKQKKWREMAASAGEGRIKELKSLPYMVADTRSEVDAYLGFRHVTGIKEWSPTEKAEFIAKLVDGGRSYLEVMRLIGSTTDSVRRNYISFKLLKQMEVQDEIPIEDVEDRFSILSLSIRTPGVQNFLGINIKAEPPEARTPSPVGLIENLKDFATWTFGNEAEGIEPILPESRNVDDFGKILDSKDAVAYMRSTKNPNFEVAYRIAGGDMDEIVKMIQDATYQIQRALSTVHHHKTKHDVVQAVEKLTTDYKQLLMSFPDISRRHFQAVIDV